MTSALHGSCLCGEIRFEIHGKIGPAGQCHCSKCRKVSGTDGNAVFYAPAASFRWLAGSDCGIVNVNLGTSGAETLSTAANIFVGSKAPCVCIADSATQYEAGFGSARIDR